MVRPTVVTNNNGTRFVYRTHTSKRGKTYRRRIKYRLVAGEWERA